MSGYALHDTQDFITILGIPLAAMNGPLFRPLELAFRTQYAEPKERARSTETILPGSPGTFVKRSATGRSYWYRAYQEATGRQVEDLVGRETDEHRYEQAVGAVEFARWMGVQVRTLRKLEFQVAATFAAVLTEQDDDVLPDSAAELPAGMKKLLVARVAVLEKSLDPHPAAQDALRRALSHA